MTTTKPDYYKGKSGRDVIDVISDFDLNFTLGNALKYIIRAGKKDPDKRVEDLQKAVECLKRGMYSSVENAPLEAAGGAEDRYSCTLPDRHPDPDYDIFDMIR